MLTININKKAVMQALLLGLTAFISLILISSCAVEVNPLPEEDAGEHAQVEGASAPEISAVVEVTSTAEPIDTVSPAPTETVAPTVESVDSPQETLAVYNGLIITATGEEPIADGVVLIEGGVITFVGTEAEIALPDDATLIDAEGGTIMPGLIDGRASDLLNRLRLEDGQIHWLDMEVYLARTLKAGVTTVRATGWDWQKQQDNAAMRVALDGLGNLIPTVIISGTSLAHGEGAGVTKYYADNLVGVITVEEASQVTEDLIELNVDQINLIMAVGPEIQSGKSLPVLSPQQLEAIVETAHAQGKPVIAQAIFEDEVETVVAAGVDQLSNWPHLTEPMTDEMIEMLVTSSVPLLSGFGVERPLEGDVRRFLDAGGKLVYGSFAPNAGPLDGPYNEFQRMSLVGDMTPIEIIFAATGNAAEAVGLGDQVGTLEVGKTADIIVLDGSPLEDLRVFRDGVTAVIKGGELVPLDS